MHRERSKVMNPQPPWSVEELREAYFREKNALQVNLEKMPGFQTAKILEMLRLSFSIFRSATEDLFETIHKFKLLEDRRLLYERNSESLVAGVVQNVQRGIFASCSAAMALVDHTRRISRKLPIEGYDSEVNARFGEVPLHSFIQGLRNYSSHRSVAEANWQVNFEFETQRATVSFLLSAAQLLEWDEWSNDAKKFIESNHQGIDTEAIFKEYTNSVAEFQHWLRYKVRKYDEPAYQQYLHYKNIVDGFRAYYNINLLISHLKPEAKDDPEMYLDRFLSDEQLDVVLSFPKGSPERVDRIITFVDTHGACDHALREKLMHLFGVSECDA